MPDHPSFVFWIQQLSLLLFTVMLAGSITLPNKVLAESVTTSVTVGNSAPSFDGNPYEDPASTDASPTNVGGNVTFKATADDSNNEDFYLIVCKTNSVAATNGGAPTCPGSSWCVSGTTSSGSEADCSYTVQSGDTAENYAWYAFVCDANASAASCSSASQGSGDSGSTFSVNHAPAFTAISEDGPKNPGESITWSATAADSDTATVADTVKLIVCKTAGITNDDCDGGGSDRWCVSDPESSNPSCSYEIPVPTVDDTYAAYVYIVDNHNFASGGTPQGTNESYDVNNVAPVVSAVSLNSGSSINLSEGTSTPIVVSATITDNNSCVDLDTVQTSLYRSAITYAGCDTGAENNANHCYAEITCTVGGGNTCDDTTDASASYTCTVNVQYYADPTDANTEYSAQNWLATVFAADNDSANDNTEVASGVEVNSLVAMDVTSAINYGSLAVGDKNDPLDKTTTVTATGNVGLDQELSGTDMTDGGSGLIDVAYQKYALAASTAYASGTSLSETEEEVALNCPKTISMTPATADTYWGLEIPAITTPGSYSGTNTVTAIKSAPANW